MYSTWAFDHRDNKYEEETKVTKKEKVIIIGGGPNRIGQGIEFDYCCVHSSYAIKEIGIESIMINCNLKLFQQILIHQIDYILNP